MLPHLREINDRIPLTHFQVVYRSEVRPAGVVHVDDEAGADLQAGVLWH